MQHPLINLADFKDYLEMPEALAESRLLPHVREVQRQRLWPQLEPWPLLQAALQDYVASLATPAEDTPERLLLGQLWQQYGKPLLVYAAYARFLPFAKATLTAHSLVEKLSDQSTPAPDSSISKQITIYLDTAQSYQVELGKWLQAQRLELAIYGTLPSCSSTPAQAQGTVTHLFIRNRRR